MEETSTAISKLSTSSFLNERILAKPLYTIPNLSGREIQSYSPEGELGLGQNRKNHEEHYFISRKYSP
ncbi:hypothetical protein [Spongiibacter tropicus]|uniref:hypothetical protein n=1 Tax=Spongiibacter tropicus TaxID=454602 RepID=UPI0024E241DA|nr:hypothetical protein [Spongiibacter tropicus]